MAESVADSSNDRSALLQKLGDELRVLLFLMDDIPFPKARNHRHAEHAVTIAERLARLVELATGTGLKARAAVNDPSARAFIRATVELCRMQLGRVTVDALDLIEKGDEEGLDGEHFVQLVEEIWDDLREVARLCVPDVHRALAYISVELIDAVGSPLTTVTRLSDAATAAAEFIRANPGRTSEQIADAANCTPEHFRGKIWPKLRSSLGFTKGHNGQGYYPS